MFKEIISDFKEFRLWLLNYLFYRRHAIKLKLAIALADIKQKAFNRRYFVVLLETPGKDRLVSINNKEFEIFKRKKWLPQKMSYLELEEYSFYQTALGLNNRQSSEQRKEAKRKYLKYAMKCMR
jgi:hypothetical protein